MLEYTATEGHGIKESKFMNLTQNIAVEFVYGQVSPWLKALKS